MHVPALLEQGRDKLSACGHHTMRDLLLAGL